MQKSLLNFLLEKQKLKTITSVEKKVMDLYLQTDVLRQYFDIAINYCKTNKIQKEVEELHPAWTGYENYYWYTYHYDAFGNALYSYTQIYESILKLLTRKVDNFPQAGKTYLEEFLSDSLIDKIVKERHDSVHQFGKWRSELSDELGLQDWKSAETKIINSIAEAHEQLKLFDAKITNFISEQLQLKQKNNQTPKTDRQPLSGSREESNY